MRPLWERLAAHKKLKVGYARGSSNVGCLRHQKIAEKVWRARGDLSSLRSKSSAELGKVDVFDKRTAVFGGLCQFLIDVTEDAFSRT